MNWITKHSFEIIDISDDQKSCLVKLPDGRTYGCPVRKHDGHLYFSVDDRCIWYLIREVSND